MDGPNGCGVGQDDNRVMVLPVATSITDPPQRQAYSVMWLPFLVIRMHANEHAGQLLSDAYLLRLNTNTTSSWTINDGGLVAARLVN